MWDATKIRQHFANSGAILKTHRVLASGRHGAEFVEAEHALARVKDSLAVTEPLAFAAREFGVEVVIGPAVGGNTVAYAVAVNLVNMGVANVIYVPTEKVGKTDFVVKELWKPWLAGKRLFGVEDVSSRGTSISSLETYLRSLWGTDYAHFVLGGAVWNRGNVTAEMFAHVPHFISIVDEPMESWEPANCPLCQRNVPLES